MRNRCEPDTPVDGLATRWANSELAGKLGPALLIAGRLVRRRLEIALADAGLDLTAAQAKVIVMLHLHGPLSQQALAALTDVDPSTLVRTLDVMEREELALRAPDPTDRRAYRVSLTERGKRRVPRLFALWDGIEDDLARALPGGELDRVRRALGRMIADLAQASGPEHEANGSEREAEL